MGSGTLYALGGLLQGAGQAITNDAEQRRQDALEALKREYDVEDRDAKLTAAKDINTANNQTKLDAIKATGAENRSTEAVKGAVDQSNIILKGSIDLSNNKTLDALKHTYNLSEDQAKAAADLQNQLAVLGIKADHYQVTTDGKLVAFNGKGQEISFSAHPNSYVPSGAGNSDSSDLSSLLNPDQAKAAGSGAAPAKGKAAAPAAASKPTAPMTSNNTGKSFPPGWDGTKEAQFEQLYTQASPATAPRLFRDGKKIPADEARLMISGQL